MKAFRLTAALAALCCCATPVLAQRSSTLSRVQVLALQQQLRDDGCGIRHTTGRIDATTRRALKQCQSKYNASSADPMTVLQAMNIGFGPNDTKPSLAEARSGGAPGGAMAADTTGGRAMRGGEEARESRRTQMREHRIRRGRASARDATASAAMENPDSIGVVRVYYATDREENRRLGTERYGTAWHDSVAYGMADVTIPPDHTTGELERPQWYRAVLGDDPTRDVVVESVTPESEDAVLTEMAAHVDSSARHAVMIFVHGYNETFADALRRTAQITWDMNLHLTPFMFSWPSKGKLVGYLQDKNTADLAVPHLEAVIRDLATRTHARTFHIVAHSMGGYVTTQALMALAGKPGLPPINTVVLAAPDIDATQFQHTIEPAIRATAQRFTIYTSRNDKALIASHKAWGRRRLGEAPIGGLDSNTEFVDSSDLTTEWLGHSYSTENVRAIEDLYNDIVLEEPAAARNLYQVNQPNLTYWRFRK